MVQDMDGADPTGMARNTPSGGTPGIAPGTVVLITHDDVLWFETPREIHACDRVEDVSATLAAIETAARGGSHLAGYLAYEAGRAFEPKLAALPGPEPGSGLPLVWFGAYDAPRRMTPDEALDRLVGDTPQASIAVEGFDMDARAHEAAFERVRDHLACGDIYQANLTMRARGKWSGHPGALFARLLRGQPVGHAALLRLDRHWVLSLSPELFLEREGERLRTRPMKGTLARGRDAREDDALAASLALDPKSRAENVMIVDLLRNDLSRVAEPGSVRVPRLFEVESYATLFQMTSTVEANLVPDTGFAAIIARLFPCGSITGAPKLRAMEILNELEPSPRGIYTGSIGHLAPDGDFRFNVAIRTLVAGDDGRFEMGTGSGVVFDSQARPEFEECALKLHFLTRSAPDFSLFETLRLEPGSGYTLLESHLARLLRSASMLGFRHDAERLRRTLEAHAETVASDSDGGARRVRLQLDPDGTVSLTDAALPETRGPWHVAISEERLDPCDPLLFHKTTQRALYDGERARLGAETGCDEVVFLNRDGLVSEGAISNVFIARHGRLLTPPLGAGLLPGTLRAALLETGRAFEAELTLEDLLAAESLYCGNSLRGLVESRIQSRKDGDG
uniref:aminodeoxychorismate synthase component I n=1 Tax=Stappia sp. TaxID=1870903 RepID=UPI003BAAB534